MAEGDTLVRIATVLRAELVGQRVVAARARGGAQLGRLVGARAVTAETRGKHLLIGFDDATTLHAHLGLSGSVHRYRRGQSWRGSPARAAAVLETEATTFVFFDAPTIELLETRALAIHPQLRALGPDASAADFDIEASLRRLRAPENAEREVGDALLDQRVVAGLGNVYRSELAFIERIDPRTPIGALDDDVLRRLLTSGSRLLRANAGGGRRVTTTPGTAGSLYVYGRTGRPCRRCGRPIRSATAGQGRRLYWCPSCQPG
jgi:endonuclease-8